ncbi:MAG: PadR family transcriptional regulator [Oscillospiraceae bacterium]|nr:PadR family transcriptional regulator [Oscillospiraceae bacterium]
MDTQLKKGLLDTCILKCLEKEDSYGYKLINDVSAHVEVSESTLYPILKRLEEAKYLSTYKEEHNNRLRKYFKITDEGRKKLKEQIKEVQKLREVIKFIEKEYEGEKENG